ncbi:MAG: glycosyltransferase family 4 protein [Blastocatellia bacterium]|nr:glycosyltransferase family 4 protein [Blastocatellia bacterium]
MKPPLLYALHSGNLYGTERMALATAVGLAADFEPVFFAPPGPALQEAGRLGFQTQGFASAKEFALHIRPFFARHRELLFFATGLVHSLACLGWNAMYRRQVVHLHLVHGGTDEHLSYGRKKYLNGWPVEIVAVSDFVKARLVAHGVRPTQVSVLENFLPDALIAQTPKRNAFEGKGISRLIVVSRADPIKRLDVLLDALESNPALAQLPVRIFGTGAEFETLRNRAAVTLPAVEFSGYSEQIPQHLAQADLLVHTCPVEPFGLVVLEGMAAHVPALVPDSGGASSIIVPEESGFQFRANQVGHLAEKLLELKNATAAKLNSTVAKAAERLQDCYSSEAGLEKYRQLIARAQAGQSRLAT